MARIRTIKPEFCTSEQIAECSPNARLLFVCMWCFCDDNGIHVNSAKRLKMEVFPADNFTADDIVGMVDELLHASLLERYEVDGTSFLRVTGWHKHQKIDQPNYRHPLPNGEVPEKRSRRGGGNSPNAPRTTDDTPPNVQGSRNERSPPEWNGRERTRKNPHQTSPTAERPPARVVAEAFITIREGLWPDNPAQPAPTMTLEAEAGQWLAAGGTVEVLIATLRAQMTGAKGTGKAPPTSLKAYRLSLQDAVATQRATAERAAADTPNAEDPHRTRWRLNLKRYRETGVWYEHWGAKPGHTPRAGEPPCQAPPDLISEILGAVPEAAE